MAIEWIETVKVLGAVGGVGALMGAGLAAASQVFHVEEDARLVEAREALPGINCGACGYAGCGAYAEAAVTDSSVPVNLCSPGGQKTADKLAEITGKTAGSGVKTVAILKCVQDQSKASTLKYNYHGLEDCAAVETLHKGSYNCPFACVGLGNCARICPVDAITMEKGRPVIDADKCIACGLCIKTCPRDSLTLAPYPGRVQVYCRNTMPAKLRRKICPSACIGCTICMKNCPYGAIEMVDKVAVVHHEKCPADCDRPCITKCPTKAILAR